MPPAGGFACSEGGVGWGWTWESEAERQRRQGMGTFSLTPKRRGGRGLSQRPGRRKELAKQSRKDRKKGKQGNMLPIYSEESISGSTNPGG